MESRAVKAASVIQVRVIHIPVVNVTEAGERKGVVVWDPIRQVRINFRAAVRVINVVLGIKQVSS